MSASRRPHRLVALALSLTAAATLAACSDGPTQPRPAKLTTLQTRLASDECFTGWIIVDGKLVCAP